MDGYVCVCGGGGGGGGGKNGSILPNTARSGGKLFTVVLSLVMSPSRQNIVVHAGRRVAAPAISSATNLSAGCRQISPFRYHCLRQWASSMFKVQRGGGGVHVRLCSSALAIEN